MRKLAILAVLVLVAVAAVPAFASVQNIKISGAIDNTYLYRSNFDFGQNTSGDDVQSLGLTQTQVHVDADLTDNVSTTVGLINERAWGDVDNAGAVDEVQLYLAYVTLREMLYSPLTVVVGRQAFKYGNSFIVDSAGINNVAPASSGINGIAEDLTKATTLDAVRTIFDYNPLTLEFVYANLDTNANNLVVDDDNIDLYGANATYELGDDMGTEVETYLFAKIDRGANDESGVAGSVSSQDDTIYTPGFRVSTNPIEGLNVQAELAWQRGNKIITTAITNANAQRDAIGGQFIASYQLPVAEEYNPMLQYIYTHVSGDSNPGDLPEIGGGAPASGTKWTAWDPMLVSQGAGQIWNAVFDLSNADIHLVKLQANPMEDVTASFMWTGIWLDKEISCESLGGGATCLDTSSFLQPDGTSEGPGTRINDNQNDLGHEFDAMLSYDYTEDVKFGASFGWFLPGDVFNGANDQTAFQALVNGNVNF